MKPLKRLERYVTALFKFGRTEWMAKQAYRDLPDINNRLNDIKRDLDGLAQDISRAHHKGDAAADALQDLSSRIADLAHVQSFYDERFVVEHEKAKAGDAAIGRTVSDVTRRLDDLVLHRDRLARPAAADNTADLPVSDGFDAFKDAFYHRLENRYRGSKDEISNRLRIYLPDVEAAFRRTKGLPVMDIGCGRGEWLGLLSEAGIAAFGVDTNAVQIDEARKHGLDVRHGDALKTLSEAEDNSLSVITAHHVVEHLPFDAVAWIAREAIRVLAPGGILLVETPHTRNVLVGATTFHTDPTHLKPMPEQVLAVLFETAGFYPIEIRPLHAHERLDEFIAKPDFNNELAFLMFGPQDLSILGTKPLED